MLLSHLPYSKLKVLNLKLSGPEVIPNSEFFRFGAYSGATPSNHLHSYVDNQ